MNGTKKIGGEIEAITKVENSRLVACEICGTNFIPNNLISMGQFIAPWGAILMPKHQRLFCILAVGFRRIPRSLLRGFLFFMLVLWLSLATTTQAQQNFPFDKVGGAKSRIALIIGNAAYKQGPLNNPINDTRAIAKLLRSFGFELVQRENLKAREIGAVYREFRSKITPGGVALVFYAGHGVQFKGQNYFPAVDSDIASEEEVPLQSIHLGTLLDIMDEAKAGINLILLDACRDNPFARRFRSTSRGLAKVEAASGTLIHYATRPGSVALDGDGENGIYTEALLAQIGEPGIPVEQMLKLVANRVVAKTQGLQEPWIEGSLRGDFYFNLNRPLNVQVQTTTPDPETEAWRAAESINQEASYQTYLDEYFKGRFAVAAKIKLAALKSAKLTPISPAPALTVPISHHTQDNIAYVPIYKSSMIMKEPQGISYTEFKDCNDCPDMVVMPTGSFEMGSLPSEAGRVRDEDPRHSVQIERAFALAKTEVTQLQWRAIMGIDPPRLDKKNCDDCPVGNVSWIEASEFVQRLSDRTGKTYRLPSEAEWEFACRAGGIQRYCGSDSVERVAWYENNSVGKVHSVAGKQSNAWGIFDMSGNVWEWTEDCWNPNYAGAPNDGSPWIKGDCNIRVMRGGSWRNEASYGRSAGRSWGNLTDQLDFFGFRCARDFP